MISRPISVVVVDDEKPARDELRFIIDKNLDFKVVGEADCGLDAIGLVDYLKPEVLFLDIEMGDMNGLEVARKNMHKGNNPATIFATAYNQHAIEAFDVRAVDYILKPFEDERVAETLKRLKDMLVDREPAQILARMQILLSRMPSGAENAKEGKKGMLRIPAEHNGRLLLLDPKEIFFVSTGSDKSVTIHSRSGTYRLRTCLNKLEEKLNNSSYHFFRVHRSFLVNLDETRELIPWFKGNYLLVMGDDKKTEIPVSRLCSKELKDSFDM